MGMWLLMGKVTPSQAWVSLTGKSILTGADAGMCHERVTHPQSCCVELEVWDCPQE